VPATTRAAVKKIAFANRGKVQQVADEDLPHGESINRYIAAAKDELAAAENRCVWDYYAVHDKLLGRGGFARVFRSKCLATGDPVAIKVISRDNPESFELQEAGEFLLGLFSSGENRSGGLGSQVVFFAPRRRRRRRRRLTRPALPAPPTTKTKNNSPRHQDRGHARPGRTPGHARPPRALRRPRRGARRHRVPARGRLI
jgi:hypothetical protein